MLSSVAYRRHISVPKKSQTPSEEVKDNTPIKWHSEKSGCSHTYNQQNRFQKKVVGDKDKYFITIKGKIYQKDVTLINMYVPNLEVPKYIKQLLTDIKRETEKVNYSRRPKYPLTAMDRSSRQKNQ